MAQYKEGNERLSQTGGGMDGIELTTFQEWITKNVCRYYFELDTVLRDRPNVSPWYTNEMPLHPQVSNRENNRDDTSTEDVLDHNLDETDVEFMSNHEIDSRKEGRDDLENEYENCSINYSTDITANPEPITLSNSSDDINSMTTMESPIVNSSDENTSNPAIVTKNKRKQTLPHIRKLSPVEAKGIQRNLMKRKKSIARRNGSNISSNLLSMDNDDRALLKETTLAKMNIEKQRNKDLKEIESQKLRIENERLEMDRATIVMRKEQMSVQTCLERSKVVLLKLEMFKTREGIKKEYPNVTEEYLNTHFPYPE